MLGLNTHMTVHCRHDVQPDGQLYSSLMDVAGQAKRVDLAFDLQADMVAQGLQPSKVKPPSRMLLPILPHAMLLPLVHAHMSLSMVSRMHICCWLWCVMHACIFVYLPTYMEVDSHVSQCTYNIRSCMYLAHDELASIELLLLLQ